MSTYSSMINSVYLSEVNDLLDYANNCYDNCMYNLENNFKNNLKKISEENKIF